MNIRTLDATTQIYDKGQNYLTRKLITSLMFGNDVVIHKWNFTVVQT